LYKRVLLTNDGSRFADAAIPHAATFGAAGADVLVVRVSHSAGEAPESLQPESWDTYIHRSSAPDAAAPPLSDAVAALHAAGAITAGALLVRGEPGPVIIDVARRLGCDLIVMSTHGASGLKRALLGSVADHVVRHASASPSCFAGLKRNDKPHSSRERPLPRLISRRAR
jgi:nucleotide-binding universal stress UspA family protein